MSKTRDEFSSPRDTDALANRARQRSEHELAVLQPVTQREPDCTYCKRKTWRAQGWRAFSSSSAIGECASVTMTGVFPSGGRSETLRTLHQRDYRSIQDRPR